MKKCILISILIFLLTGCSENSSGSSIYSEPVQQQGETFWWNETVFYEIFVRSFYDSDGDGIGDIQGIIEKLDYLNDNDPQTTTDLGITGIWLMPISQSPSYHGYDVVDYTTIEEDYGTNADFQELIAECHSRGIKVIVDNVMNHCSNQHPWFIASAAGDPDYIDWYRWSDTNPGYLGPWGQPVWHYHNSGQYYYGLFWSGMPDLNFETAAVKDEMFDIATFWLQEMDVDGFRCDAVKHIFEDGSQLENTDETFAFWQDFNDHYKSVKPEAMAVGEAWDETAIILQYLDGRFDFCFEFDLANSILNSVNSLSPLNIRSKMAEIRDLYPYHQYGTFLTNHDQNRVYDVFDGDIDKAKLAGAVYLTLPGIPYIYYGEEIGMKGSKPDPDIRRPMQWTSGANAGFTTGSPWHNLNNNYTQYNVEDLQADDNSIWNLYRTLIQHRSEEPALTIGTYQAISSSITSIYAFIRQYENEAILVLTNFSTNVLNSPDFSAESTNLSVGDYSVMDLILQEDLQNISIDENGGFENWQPLLLLEGQTIYLLKLLKL